MLSIARDCDWSSGIYQRFYDALCIQIDYQESTRNSEIMIINLIPISVIQLLGQQREAVISYWDQDTTFNYHCFSLPLIVQFSI